jgi:hypothetical protein
VTANTSLASEAVHGGDIKQRIDVLPSTNSRTIQMQLLVARQLIVSTRIDRKPELRFLPKFLYRR